MPGNGIESGGVQANSVRSITRLARVNIPGPASPARLGQGVAILTGSTGSAVRKGRAVGLRIVAAGEPLPVGQRVPINVPWAGLLATHQ
jgi:hypothetical protein